MTRSGLKLLVGLALSAGALYFLLSGLNTDALRQAWSRLSTAGLLLAVSMLAMGYSLRIVRWWWMLRSFEPRVRVLDCATPFLASIALNNVLPFRAGDAVRAFGFQRQLGLSAATVLGTVLLERLLDLAMLLAFLFAGAARVPATALPAGMTTSAAVLAVAAVAVVIALPFVGPALARRLSPRRTATAVAPSWRASLREGAATLLDSFALLRSPRQAALLLPLTVLIWVLEGAVFASVAADLSSQTAPIAAWFAMATGTLATLLPSTPGYVGTFDYFTMLGLLAFGASREVAAAFSLSVHAVLWVPVTAAGFALLALHGGITAFRPEPAGTASRATAR
jgi:uncharacterized protein (TIRG00374 family)